MIMILYDNMIFSIIKCSRSTSVSFSAVSKKSGNPGHFIWTEGADQGGLLSAQHKYTILIWCIWYKYHMIIAYLLYTPHFADYNWSMYISNQYVYIYIWIHNSAERVEHHKRYFHGPSYCRSSSGTLFLYVFVLFLRRGTQTVNPKTLKPPNPKPLQKLKP